MTVCDGFGLVLRMRCPPIVGVWLLVDARRTSPGAAACGAYVVDDRAARPLGECVGWPIRAAWDALTDAAAKAPGRGVAATEGAP